MKQVLEAVAGFIDPLSSSVEDNELFFLSSGVPAKPDIAKLLHFLESHNEPIIDRLCKPAHNFNGNAILQSLTAFPVTFQNQA